MNNEFLKLPNDAQLALINSTESTLGLIDVVIEKDIWLCKVLEVLFSMPQTMVFKGGTSLSKAYGLINRFSEDVDITIDYHNFRHDLDLQGMTRSQLKKVSQELKNELANFIKGTVYPYLVKQFQLNFPDKKFDIIVNDDGERLHFHYPTVLNSRLGYLRDHILLEFGMRNEVEPQEAIVISPYLASGVKQALIFPTPTINTLSPIRTFWEKATLMHVECHRNRLVESPDRLSRHWYDVHLLCQTWVGKQAIANKSILEKVVNHKKAFYNVSYANYDKCLQGEFKLIPVTLSLEELKTDYKKMCDAGMFLEKPPTFSAIIETLLKFEKHINHVIPSTIPLDGDHRPVCFRKDVALRDK